MKQSGESSHAKKWCSLKLIYATYSDICPAIELPSSSRCMRIDYVGLPDAFSSCSNLRPTNLLGCIYSVRKYVLGRALSNFEDNTMFCTLRRSKDANKSYAIHMDDPPFARTKGRLSAIACVDCRASKVLDRHIHLFEISNTMLRLDAQASLRAANGVRSESALASIPIFVEVTRRNMGNKSRHPRVLSQCRMNGVVLVWKFQGREA